MTILAKIFRFSRLLHYLHLQGFTGCRLQFGIIVTFIVCPVVYAKDIKEKSAQLDSVRDKIEDVKTSMKKARIETRTLQAELRNNEIFSGSITQIMREIEQQLQQRSKRLDKLLAKKSSHEKVLAGQKLTLSQQVRSAYIVGKNDYLKLLLNQEDPARVGRVLAYHDYHNRAMAGRIHLSNTEIEAITKLTNNIDHENNALLKLKRSQLVKNKEVDELRKKRSVILAKLLDQVKKQGRELQVLQRQEQETKKLLEKLSENQGSVAVFEDIPPFGSLKGQLDWPVQGKLLTRFGGNKREGKLKWQGVIIGADIGVEVKAISGGQVIFADWFRNLGLLMIVDHGSGYMSLYGYNQGLLKNTGDWVLPGETIALAGDSGGQLRSGVYFEIRNNGSPMNPAKWCRS